ncbi:hypothetical protein OHR68_18680 [Spirillospora sp. NBC_00431]
MDLLIDQLLPAYDFRVRYTRRITAGPDRVWTALHAVTHDELPVTRLLMAVRHAGRNRLSGPVFQALPIPLLEEREDREAIAGKVAKFWRPRPVPGPDSTTTPEGFAAFAEPGWAKAAMSFQLSPLPGGGTLLAAETRIRATDAAARRAFAPYWLLIRVGGAGFIRLEMLRAIARRAERSERSGREAQPMPAD